MEKVSPTVHLVIRSCIFCTTLVAFFTLLGANFYKISIRGKRLQTLALLFKLILDLIPVILTALNSSTSLEEGESEACLGSGHKMTDGWTDRNHSVYRLHPALLLFHIYNKL